MKSEVVLPLDRDQIIVPRLLSVINRYRDKAKIDLNVIRGIVDTYVLIERMSYDFEKEYSNATAEYYKHEINMMLNDFGVSIYYQSRLCLTKLTFDTDPQNFIVRE